MLKYLSKFVLEIMPSIVATVVGAYIVTHYINDKSSDAPKAAAASTQEPAREVKPETAAKSDETDKAKPSESKSADKAEKQTETKRQTVSRDKGDKTAADKASSKSVSSPAVAVTVAPAPAESASAAEETRDANDLARAALDRLRGPVEAARQPDAPARPAEPARASVVITARPAEPVTVGRPPEASRINTAAVAPQQPQVQQNVQPLPPAVLVNAPSSGNAASNAPAAPPQNAAKDDRPWFSLRQRPPAEIPVAPPLDLQAAGQRGTSIAEDVVSTAKSVFHAVIPR